MPKDNLPTIGLSGLIGITLGIIGTMLVKNDLEVVKSISFQINPLEILSLGVNMFLAIYVSRVISQKNEQEKSEKEIIINYVKSYQSDFHNKINKMLGDDLFGADPEVTSNFKALRSRIHSIIDLSEESSVIDKNTQLSNDIKQKISDIWTLFTDVPRNPSNKTNADTKNDMRVLKLDKISKIETACIDFDKLILQFAMVINKKGT